MFLLYMVADCELENDRQTIETSFIFNVNLYSERKSMY